MDLAITAALLVLGVVLAGGLVLVLLAWFTGYVLRRADQEEPS